MVKVKDRGSVVPEKIANNELSIIVLTFNNYNELNKTLNSIPVKFRDSAFIVNGGSCEKTRNLVGGEFGGLSEKDKGIADAFSKGVKNTKGEIIHFLNSGDIIYSNTFYDEALSLFQNAPEVKYVYSNILYKHSLYGDLRIGPSKNALKNIAFGMPFPHPGLMVKREVFDKIGCFNDQFKIGMDYDFIVRMLKENFQGIYLDLTSVEMEGSGTSSNQPIRSTLENLKSLSLNNSLGFREISIIIYRLVRTSSAILIKKFGFKSIFERFHGG